MTNPPEDRHLQTRRLLGELEKIADPKTAARVKKISDRMKLPMQVVIDRVAGDSIAVKARALRVSRQTVYCWLNGVMRPNESQAKRLAAITGFTVEEIRGKS